MFNTPLFIHVFGFGFVYITIICDVNMAQQVLNITKWLIFDIVSMCINTKWYS